MVRVEDTDAEMEDEVEMKRVFDEATEQRVASHSPTSSEVN